MNSENGIRCENPYLLMNSENGILCENPCLRMWVVSRTPVYFNWIATFSESKYPGLFSVLGRIHLREQRECIDARKVSTTLFVRISKHTPTGSWHWSAGLCYTVEPVLGDLLPSKNGRSRQVVSHNRSYKNHVLPLVRCVYIVTHPGSRPNWGRHGTSIITCWREEQAIYLQNNIVWK